LNPQRHENRKRRVILGADSFGFNAYHVPKVRIAILSRKYIQSTIQEHLNSRD